MASNRNNIYFDSENLKLDLKKKAVRGAGATLFAQGAMFFINFMATIILARLLTPEDFGLVGMVMVFSLLFQNFGMRGFTEVTVQRETIDHKTVSTLFWLHLALTLIVSLIFIGISPLIAWFYDEPRLKGICMLIPATFIFSSLSTQHLALLRRNMQYYRVTGVDILSTLIACLVAIALATLDWGYWALVSRRIALPLFSAVFAWGFCRWVPGMPAKLAHLGEIVRFAMHTYGNFLVNYCSRHLDYLLIGWRHGAQSLGNYQKAYDLFVLPANQLTYPLTNIFVTTLSQYKNEPREFISFFTKSVGLLAFIAMPLSPILTLIGKDLILLLLGPQWDEAGKIFSAFGISIGIMVVYGTHGWLHLALGTPKNWIYWGIVEFGVTAILFIIGLGYGAVGVALAWSTSYYILTLPGIWYAGRGINLKLSVFLTTIWKYFLSALFSGLIVWYFFWKFEPLAMPILDLNLIIRMLLVSLSCFVSYLLLVIVLHRNLGPIATAYSVARDMIPKFSLNKNTE